MPDLLSHSLSAYLVEKPLRLRTNISMFYLGVILPDIISWLPSKILWAISLLIFVPSRVYYLFEPFHSPIILILTAFLISFLFEEQIRKDIFSKLIGGVFLHLFLDILQRKMDGGYLLLYPFSFHKFQVGLFWTDKWVYVLGLLLLLSITLLIKLRNQSKI